MTAAQRWVALADRLHPELSDDPGWSALADSIDRAAAAGVDVAATLPALAARDPLPADHTARSLHYRLITACGDALTPAQPEISRTSREHAETAARARLAIADQVTANGRPRPVPERTPPRAPGPPPPSRPPPATHRVEVDRRRRGPSR